MKKQPKNERKRKPYRRPTLKQLRKRNAKNFSVEAWGLFAKAMRPDPV